MPDGRPGDLIHSLPECLMEFCKVKLTWESVDEILWCDHSNETSLPVRSHDAICFSKFYKIWKFGRNLPLATFGSERVNPSVPEQERMPGWMMEYNDMGVLNFEFSDETLWTASFQTNSLPEYFYLALLVFEQMIQQNLEILLNVNFCQFWESNG